jgi:hypothetical protein
VRLLVHTSTMHGWSEGRKRAPPPLYLRICAVAIKAFEAAPCTAGGFPRRLFFLPHCHHDLARQCTGPCLLFINHVLAENMIMP